ncbi:MAG: hypothetical protein ABIR68_16160 [Ilumatobacteraceae bacterium]
MSAPDSTGRQRRAATDEIALPDQSTPLLFIRNGGPCRTESSVTPSSDSMDSAPSDAPSVGDPAELALVDLLCRMQLMAMRLGCRIVVVEPTSELRDLIVLAGVDDVLLCPACDGTRVNSPMVQPASQPETESGR